MQPGNYICSATHFWNSAFNQSTSWQDKNLQYVFENFLLQSLHTSGLFACLNTLITAFEVSRRLKIASVASIHVYLNVDLSRVVQIQSFPDPLFRII